MRGGKRERTFSHTVRCYDCDKEVWDLRAHRSTCPRSRKAKSRLEGNTGVSRPKISDGKDFYALIDVSGSMFGTRLENAKKALLEDVEPAMLPNDRIAIVTFDSEAFFKLKPRPVEQIRRQNELRPLMDRIFARGQTAIWDAIYMAVSQIRDKTRPTVIVTLTDGGDNSSRHTYAECLALVAEYPAISLSIINVTDGEIVGAYCDEYRHIAEAGHGEYTEITTDAIQVTLVTVFTKYYRAALK